MTVNRPRTREEGVPTLQDADLAELDKIAPDIKRDITDLLRTEPLVNSQKVVLCMQFALYEHVLLNDVFVDNVLTEEFRAGVEDILKIFRQLNGTKDRQVRKDNINDRAEAITAFLMNAIHLARESFNPPKGFFVDVYEGVEETAKDIGKIFRNTSVEKQSADGGEDEINDDSDDDNAIYMPGAKKLSRKLN